jgi:hypothetical protein
VIKPPFEAILSESQPDLPASLEDLGHAFEPVLGRDIVHSDTSVTFDEVDFPDTAVVGCEEANVMRLATTLGKKDGIMEYKLDVRLKDSGSRRSF